MAYQRAIDRLARRRDRQRRYAARQRAGTAVYQVEAGAATIEALVAFNWLPEADAENHAAIACAMSRALAELGVWHRRRKIK
jgi:hypothetical protein